MSQPRLLLTLLMALALGCARDDRSEPERCPPLSDAGAPVDPALLAFLSRARSAHHTADLMEANQKAAEAIAVLEGLTQGPFPGARELAPEIREVLADTRARLADLKSSQGNFDAAAQEIDKGLELAREPSYFRGHLFEVRGALEERRAKALEKSADAATVKAAKDRAVEAYQEAMKIQAGVIERSLQK